MVSPILTLANEDRWIDIEFDAIENAQYYEIELAEKIDTQKFIIGTFKTENPAWNKKVQPGNYFIRIRSIDKRNAPGPWSEDIFIPIKLPEVKILFPLHEAIIETDENESSHKINFEWLPVKGAKLYQVIVYDNKEIILYNELTDKTNFQVLLNKRSEYSFEVIPMIEKDENITKKLNLYKFKLTYGKIPAPKPEIKNTPNSLAISWDETIKDATYSLNIFKITENQEEKPVTKKELTATEFIINKKNISEGTYKLTLVANKDGYLPSTTSQIVYEYEKNEIKIIVEKYTGIFDEEKRKVLNNALYGFLSYPSLNYEFQNYENDTLSKQKLSGEAIEIGHALKTNQTLFNLPLSLGNSVRIMNLADNYASALFIKADALVLFEKKYNTKFMLLPTLGLFINKTPALVINRLNPNSAQEENFLTLGPSLGLKSEYRYNEQMIFKAGYLLRINSVPLNSMPDNKQKMSLDHELNFQAGYAFRTHLNLVLKGTYLNETILSTPSTKNGSFAKASDENKITNAGFLMSFGGEWFF